jgi:SRSO17 transposase
VIGSRAKYLVTLGSRVVGAISFCSAAYKLGPRDEFIGWDEPTRLAMLPGLVCNNRFLILPWIKVRNLASRALSLSLERLKGDWARLYGVEPVMAETFVDSERFRGTCYAAANWIRLGQTKGFGRQGTGFVRHGAAKDVYVKIMSRRFASAFQPSLERVRADDGGEDLLSMMLSAPFHRQNILEELGVEDMDPVAMHEALSGHLSQYIRHLTRKEQLPHFVIMQKGLLSDLKRKSIEPICLNYASPAELRNMQFFMSGAGWDHEGMLGTYQEELLGLLNHPEAMLCVDGCDFPKKGDQSVGVARQYCGRLGKTDNCQASVMAGVAGPEGYGLLDYELYMPKGWLEAEGADKRREKCRVPAGLEFKTKNQLATEMIAKAIQNGFAGRYVGVDSAFGRDHSFLDALAPGLTYFADVPCDHMVFPSRPEVAVPEYSGKGRKPTQARPSFAPSTVAAIAGDDAVPWADAVLGIGAKGPVIAKDKCLRVVESRDGMPGKDVWLYVRRLEDGSVKYALCTESMDAGVEAVRKPALMRWAIERCFKECKDHLGMDHYELRSWHGWRRHILLVLIAHLFVIKLRRRYGAMVDEPGPAPHVDVPVPLDDYIDAARKLQNGEEIEHKDIHPYPVTMQYPLTMGLVMKLICSMFPKVGQIFKEIDFEMKKNAAAFCSHTKSKLANVIGRLGPVMDG